MLSFRSTCGPPADISGDFGNIGDRIGSPTARSPSSQTAAALHRFGDPDEEEAADIRRMRQRTYEACMAEVESHLDRFLRQYPRGAYEGWIGTLHPENLQATAHGEMVVDHRFYGKGSDHRRLWNSRVDHLRQVADRSCEASPRAASSRTLQPSRSTPLLPDYDNFVASGASSRTGSICIPPSFRMRTVEAPFSALQPQPLATSVQVRPRVHRRLSYPSTPSASSQQPVAQRKFVYQPQQVHQIVFLPQAPLLYQQYPHPRTVVVVRDPRFSSAPLQPDAALVSRLQQPAGIDAAIPKLVPTAVA